LEVTENQNASDWTFKVNIYNRSSNYLPLLNQYSATADAYIELLQSSNGKSIYNTNLTGIKSTASLPEIARKMSELNAVNEICDKVMFMLVEQYIMF